MCFTRWVVLACVFPVCLATTSCCSKGSVQPLQCTLSLPLLMWLFSITLWPVPRAVPTAWLHSLWVSFWWSTMPWEIVLMGQVFWLEYSLQQPQHCFITLFFFFSSSAWLASPLVSWIKRKTVELNKMFLKEYCNSCYWHVMENWALTPAVVCGKEERCAGAGLG